MSRSYFSGSRRQTGRQFCPSPLSPSPKPSRRLAGGSSGPPDPVLPVSEAVAPDLPVAVCVEDCGSTEVTTGGDDTAVEDRAASIDEPVESMPSSLSALRLATLTDELTARGGLVRGTLIPRPSLCSSVGVRHLEHLSVRASGKGAGCIDAVRLTQVECSPYTGSGKGRGSYQN